MEAGSGGDIQQSQPVFPASISSCVLLLIDLLADGELNSSRQSGNDYLDSDKWLDFPFLICIRVFH